MRWDGVVDEEEWHRLQVTLPILCVDLHVQDDAGRVLMLKRCNPPAVWWLPGGRVRFLEGMDDAARRILRGECGLSDSSVLSMTRWYMDEIFFPVHSPAGTTCHAVTQVYRVYVIGRPVIQVDEQSEVSCRDTRNGWLCSGEVENPFLREALGRVLP